MSDIPPPFDPKPKLFRPFSEIIAGLSFLTRLPVPFAKTIDPPPLAQSMRFFALVGGIIGALNGFIIFALHGLHVPTLVVGGLACMFGLLLTGGLHEDGLADSADGLFGGKSPDQRLSIMRDSRIGSYGTMAIVTCLLMRAGAYAAMSPLPLLTTVALTAAAGAFSRAMMVDLLWATRAARSDGLSVHAGRPSTQAALFAIVSGGILLVVAGLATHAQGIAIAFLAAMAVTGLIRRLAVRLIGGQTGDICGATQVLTEITVLTVFTAMIG